VSIGAVWCFSGANSMHRLLCFASRKYLPMGLLVFLHNHSLIGTPELTCARELACIIREKWNDEEFFGERNKVCGQSGI
jgi:hypothetical protein